MFFYTAEKLNFCEICSTNYVFSGFFLFVSLECIQFHIDLGLICFELFFVKGIKSIYFLVHR